MASIHDRIAALKAAAGEGAQLSALTPPPPPPKRRPSTTAGSASARRPAAATGGAARGRDQAANPATIPPPPPPVVCAIAPVAAAPLVVTVTPASPSAASPVSPFIIVTPASASPPAASAPAATRPSPPKSKPPARPAGWNTMPASSASSAPGSSLRLRDDYEPQAHWLPPLPDSHSTPAAGAPRPSSPPPPPPSHPPPSTPASTTPTVLTVEECADEDAFNRDSVTGSIVPPPPPLPRKSISGPSTAASSGPTLSRPPPGRAGARGSFISPANNRIGLLGVDPSAAASSSSATAAAASPASAASPSSAGGPRSVAGARWSSKVADSHPPFVHPLSPPTRPPPPLASAAAASSSSSAAPVATTADESSSPTVSIMIVEDYVPVVDRKVRATLALGRIQRTRTLMQEDSEPSQRHPDYELHADPAVAAAARSAAASPSSAASSDPSPEAELTVEQRAQELWMDLHSFTQERHALHWKSTIGWLDPVTDPHGLVFREKLLKKAKPLVRAHGIPASYRGLVWEVLCCARTLRLSHPDYYASCLQQLEHHPTKSAVDIEKDVARTMHGHAKFSDLQGVGQAELKRGLCAFSFRHPVIGYAQSMSTLLATLLLHSHSEESAFWVLDSLLMRILPRDYYSKSLLGVKTDCAVLTRLVKKRLPRLHAALVKFQVDVTMFALPWLLCLFVHALPMHTAMRVWDCVFLKGSHVLLSVCMALLAKHEEALVSSRDVASMFMLLSNLGKNEYDCDALVQAALGKHHVRAVDAASMREELRGELEREYLKQLHFKQ